MFKTLRSLIAKNPPAAADRCVLPDQAAPLEIALDGLPPFAIARHMGKHNGLPGLDWNAAQAWMAGAASEAARKAARTACERAWLMHLREALGEGYRLAEAGGAALLSSLEPNLAAATLASMDRTVGRVSKVLDGIAEVPPGRNILIAFDDVHRYFDYVSRYYPEEGGEIALSGGMHIDSGCSHYVTVKANPGALEPILAHEMAHGCLSHLPLPLWLNEGLALNTERRLTKRCCVRVTPLESHLAFWGEEQIQEFWSGQAFRRPDAGSALAHDLARLLVGQLAADWERFTRFARHAHRRDAGAAAAAAHLGMDLGELIAALLQKADISRCAPDPGQWAPGRA